MYMSVSFRIWTGYNDKDDGRKKQEEQEVKKTQYLTETF